MEFMGTGVGVVINKSSWRDFFSLFGGGASSLWVNIVALFLVFLRIVAIIRVTKDIINRTNSFSLQVISVLLVTFLTPLIGLPIYFLVRPISLKTDRIPWREACAANLVPCYNCATLNPKEYECCIVCGERLKIKCKQCDTMYAHSFAYCNHCGAPNLDV